MIKLFFATALLITQLAFAEKAETTAAVPVVAVNTAETVVTETGSTVTEKSIYDEAAIPLKLAADKAQMGELFKAIAIFSEEELPLGFY